MRKHGTVTQLAHNFFGFDCPNCGEDLVVNVDEWGDIGYAPHGWDPGDPGESPAWFWPHGFVGCPYSLLADSVEELCTFWPGGDPDFHHFMSQIASDAQEQWFEHCKEMAEQDRAEYMAFDRRYGRDW